jgi:hypothetical protein
LLVQDLGLHPNYTNTLGGEFEIDVITVSFLGESRNEVADLRVGKWTNAFNAGPTVKGNFIDLDPDRFLVRVNDPSKKGAGIVSIQLSTDSDGEAYDDDATKIELAEDPTESGIFISTNLLLVSDDVDDDYTNPNVVADDTQNDRTHKVSLGGKVKVQYSSTATVVCEKEETVSPSLKTVNVCIIILRDKPQAQGGVPVISTTTVESQWHTVRERYAQVGVVINYTVSIQDPPLGVDLSDGLLVREHSTNRVLAAEAKALISACGTVDATVDIHVFYVNTVMVGTDWAYGSAVAEYYYPSEDGYLYNAFINNAANKPFTVSHELAHLLANAQHTEEGFNILYGHTSTANFPAATKRFNATQENTMRGNVHAQ